MEILLKNLIMSLAFLVAASLLSQDAGDSAKKKPLSVRFHSGTILAAEIMPDNPSSPVVVKNVSPYEPLSRMTSDVAYVAVTVKLDSGRTLSIYDYVLVNKKKDEFKCIAVREGDNDYDYNKWELLNTAPDRIYTLLFKVQLPAFNEKLEFVLRFTLGKNKSDELLVPLVKVDGPFTSPSKIPPEGALGFDQGKVDAAKAEAKSDDGLKKPDEGKAVEAKAEARTDGIKSKTSKWCTISYPEKLSIGQSMDATVRLVGLKSPTKLCAELHCRTTGRIYAGVYASAEPQPVSTDGEYTFKFDIKDKDNLESVNLFVFLSATGSSDDQRASETGSDISVSGATKVEKPEPPPPVKVETKPDKKDKADKDDKKDDKKGGEINMMADKSVENYGWLFDNGQEFPGATGKLSIDKTEKDALKLEGDFTKGGLYVEAKSQLKDFDLSELSFDVKYPNASAICVRIGDKSGQCHQINLKLKESSDWQKIDLKAAYIVEKNAQIVKYESWGGAGDGKWHGPATGLSFVIGPPSGKPEKKAVLWIRNIKVK
ncbi:MAG TPA: hypothetical protein DCZ94_21880 [Lentisphaeria bacterium]|nr:MAG: hypothetical protein A2X48_19275 [Lentisphaerae bacterium GWF2_49_21]HBC89596.1 hypothetical protein [Lentisphaeria bacterium]